MNQRASLLPSVLSPTRRQPPIVAAYEHFRLDRQGMLVSPRTLEYYDGMVLPFLRWLDAEGLARFDRLDVGRVRLYRAQVATRPGRHGNPLQPKTILESHRAILCFLRWARREGYRVDDRILELKAPRVPDKEPTVYHIAQVRKILTACNPAVPTEDLVVRILLGSGLRRAEICGLAVLGPDGLSDVMTDSLGRGRVELRVRWDAGAKGRKGLADNQIAKAYDEHANRVRHVNCAYDQAQSPERPDNWVRPDCEVHPFLVGRARRVRVNSAYFIARPAPRWSGP